MDHDRPDDRPKDRCPPKDLRRGKSDQHRQEGKTGIGEQVHHLCQIFDLRKGFHKGLALHKHPLRRQDIVDAHQKTGGDQRGQDRHEHIRQGL